MHPFTHNTNNPVPELQAKNIIKKGRDKTMTKYCKQGDVEFFLKTDQPLSVQLVNIKKD